MAVAVPIEIVGVETGGLKFWLITTTEVFWQALTVLVATTVKLA
jgi:hypothetical protein